VASSLDKTLHLFKHALKRFIVSICGNRIAWLPLILELSLKADRFKHQYFMLLEDSFSVFRSLSVNPTAKAPLRTGTLQCPSESRKALRASNLTFQASFIVN